MTSQVKAKKLNEVERKSFRAFKQMAGSHHLSSARSLWAAELTWTTEISKNLKYRLLAICEILYTLVGPTVSGFRTGVQLLKGNSEAKRISKRGNVLKVRGGCYNYRIKALQVTECGYKNSSSKFIMAKPLKWGMLRLCTLIFQYDIHKNV